MRHLYAFCTKHVQFSVRDAWNDRGRQLPVSRYVTVYTRTMDKENETIDDQLP